MKVRLAVLTPGRWAGQAIPVPRSPFLIGRDPRCHLRPNSPAVGSRHCALVVRTGKVFVRELRGPGGTRINGCEVHGEQELHADDRLEVGPLAFGVQIEEDRATSRPLPRTVVGDEETAAAWLLACPDGEVVAPDGAQQAGPVPESLDPRALQPPGPAEVTPGPRPPARADAPDTAAAARALLLKHKRKPQ
jgi:predicted component of type VI protein secretion system